MKVSAVGFLFQDKIKGDGLLKGKNYTCVIHKANPNGGYSRNIIKSPIVKQNSLDFVSSEDAFYAVKESLSEVRGGKNSPKFIGATIKDGIKETEVHSILGDTLYAVRTKNEAGKNRFRILNGSDTQKLLAKNLYILT